MNVPQKICTQCYYRGQGNLPGSSFIELLLWLAGILPGMLYSIWRRNRISNRCIQCGSDTMIPVASPRAIEIMRGQTEGSAGGGSPAAFTGLSEQSFDPPPARKSVIITFAQYLAFGFFGLGSLGMLITGEWVMGIGTLVIALVLSPYMPIWIKAMKKAVVMIACLSIAGCVSIPEYDTVEFEKKATHIEKTYDAPYDKIYDCLVRHTNANVVTSITKDGAYYSYAGFMKIDFIPLAKNKTKVHARSVGSYAKADEFVKYIEKTCISHN